VGSVAEECSPRWRPCLYPAARGGRAFGPVAGLKGQGDIEVDEPSAFLATIAAEMVCLATEALVVNRTGRSG
jgi:hypothetical protein